MTLVATPVDSGVLSYPIERCFVPLQRTMMLFLHCAGTRTSRIDVAAYLFARRRDNDEAVIASEAKQSISPRKPKLDCLVASLLAMTDAITPRPSPGELARAALEHFACA